MKKKIVVVGMFLVLFLIGALSKTNAALPKEKVGLAWCIGDHPHYSCMPMFTYDCGYMKDCQPN